MPLHAPNGGNPDAEVAGFYRHALACLHAHRIRYVIGGGYALEIYTQVRRPTKDIDVFVLPRDVRRTLQVTAQAGYRTELTEEHWLGKIFDGDEFIDVIFGSGNRLGQVDEDWFTYAVESRVLGMPLKLCAPEEMIWHKAFVMARDRYDGADVAHLLGACGERLDWPRLVDRFQEHWRVLLHHLILFGYVYPGHRTLVPSWVQQTLLARLQADSGPAPDEVANVCRGPFLSRQDYRQDIERWGYRDGRSAPTAPAIAGGVYR
jgi:hypothetical protein